MVEKREEYEVDRIVECVSQGTSLICEDVHFNLGGDYEFTFTIEGRIDLFYLYPYLVSRMPETFKGKWHFFPSNPGTDKEFSFEMYGVTIIIADIQVAPIYKGDNNTFFIRFYEKELCSLTEAESYNAYYIMMEILLGEGLAYQYIKEVERAEAPLGHDAIALTKLREYIIDTLTSHDQGVFDNPQQCYTNYNFTPQEKEVLRYDVIVGSTCFLPLLSDYYNEITDLPDHLNQLGSEAVFLVFPNSSEEEEDKKTVLDFRYELEDRLKTELLEPDGLGLLLGGAMGEDNMYIDLLLFDKGAFLDKIVPFLRNHSPYPCYLSDFRQHGELIRLTQEEEE